MASVTITERVIRSERAIIGAGLLAIICLAWLYILKGAGTGMDPFSMTTWQFPPPWGSAAPAGHWAPGYWLIMLAMWWIMMTAMMLPSAAPVILLYARVVRHNYRPGPAPSPTVAAACFCAGYLLSWLLFSGLAVFMQWSLERLGMLHGMMMWSTSAALSGLLLILAGIYQLSPWKNKCLVHCRSPAEFISSHWRSGVTGALRMGAGHGLYCVGCCWFLMSLLYVAGVMNILWIAGLAVIVLLEKFLPYGRQVAAITGGLLIFLGGWILLQHYFSATFTPV